MFGSNMLDVAIGMTFIYLLLSLICSAGNELLEGLLKNRAAALERGLRELLDPNTAVSPNGIVADLYRHPLINGLYKGTYDQFVASKNVPLLGWLRRPSLPSYIPARTFALALMDTVLPAENTPSGAADATAAPAANATSATALNPLQNLRAAVEGLEFEQTKKALLALIDAAGNDVSKARENIENWFNSSMDRVSGWYKRRSQTIILIIGFAVAIGVNADSIILVKGLISDKTMREALVASAQAYAKENSAAPAAVPAVPLPAVTKNDTPDECMRDPNGPDCRIVKNLQRINSLGLPIGWDVTSTDLLHRWPGRRWSTCPNPPGPCEESGWRAQIPSHALGWFITALAVSLGAPFWFDLLNKFVVVRSTVKPHEKSPEEKSKQ